MVEDEVRKQDYPVAVSPDPLRTLEEIINRFKVTRSTVKEWMRRGAPIAFTGKTYQAEYNALQAWRVAETRKTCPTLPFSALQ